MEDVAGSGCRATHSCGTTQILAC